MKKVLTISILAIMLILTCVTAVKATTNDTLADELYSLCSPYGFTSSDKVKVERYLSEYPVSDSEANSIMAKAKEATAIYDETGVTSYSDLTADQKSRLKAKCEEIADIIDVQLVWSTNQVDVYKNGSLFDSITYSTASGKLSYTGNSSLGVVVSSIAVIALASTVIVTRKKFANA